MKTIKEYNKELLDLFFISLKKDIEKWDYDPDRDYKSPIYKTNNGKDFYFVTHKDIFIASLNVFFENKYQPLSLYLCIIPINFKVWKKILLIKKIIKKKEKNKKNKKDIEKYKILISNLENNLTLEMRKEKLKNIKNEN